jgi:hypothetical protein
MSRGQNSLTCDLKSTLLVVVSIRDGARASTSRPQRLTMRPQSHTTVIEHGLAAAERVALRSLGGD